MSGHSKWSQIKHRKAAVDAKRGKLFSKLIKEITVSTRIGGADTEANPRLRSALLAAKSKNVPNDTIDKAILRGTGELEGVEYEEVVYEGYGPGGVAILIEVLTDNKNRAIADVRHILSKHGGNMGARGCVSWLFDKRGLIIVEKDSIDEDDLFMIALESEADDLNVLEDYIETITSPENFDPVRKAVEESGATISDADITMIPQNTVKLDGKEAEQMLRLMEALEDSDDVQKAYANFDIPDEILEAAA
ncbi:MAG: YebC/PmpR family DNA-binding transcriptional regulator [Candidatus Poribacteria bacterium]|nr:YebC/PmpR family DNA-binding transcriptional regulator [Candidatus Poribacteria bacterium]